MPVRPATANVLKHQLMWLWNGEWCVTTLFVLHAAAPNQAMVDADRAVITNWATVTWKPNARPVCALRRIKSWSLHAAAPAQFAPLELYPLATITGTSNMFPLPQICTVAISLRTGAVGELPKPLHGRIYWVGGVRSDELVGDTMQMPQGTADNYAARVELLRAAFTGAGNIGTWCVVSYFDGGSRALPAVRAVPLVVPITHVKCDTRIDVQRRRTPRQQSYVAN